MGSFCVLALLFAISWGDAALGFQSSVRRPLSRRTRRLSKTADEMTSKPTNQKHKNLRRVSVQLGSFGAVVGVRENYADTKIAVSLDQPLNFAQYHTHRPSEGSGSGLLPAAVIGAGIYAGLKLYVGRNEDAVYAKEKPYLVDENIGSHDKFGERSSSGMESIVRKLSSLDVLQQMRFAVAKAANYAEVGIDNSRAVLLGNKKEYLSPDTWSACSYEGSTSLGAESGITKHSFKFESRQQSFGLQMGETLMLMAIDDEGKVQRAEVIPSSSRAQSGGFDIVLKDYDEDNFQTAAFATMLSKMEQGDEVAAKAGTNRFASFDGPHGVPITTLHCVVSGTSALPALEMLRELLRGRESSIETANFVWVNARDKDFVQFSEVEKLWYRHSRVLETASILQDDVNSERLFENSAFLEVLPEDYQEGSMVILGGPRRFRSNIRAYLTVVAGFPDGVIVEL